MTDLEFADIENKRIDFIFFGTSWQEYSFKEFVKYGREHDIKSVAFLDHWINYKERFGYPKKGWQENLPDFTALSDKSAFELATKLSLPNPVKMKNYHLIDLIKRAKEKEAQNKNSLLFISEPTKKVALSHYKNENYWGFTETSALNDILENIDSFGVDKIVIRAHPSDDTRQYENFLTLFPKLDIEIEKSFEKDLIDSILSSKIVIGLDGNVLYIAYALGKISISYLPSNNRTCTVAIPKKNQIKSFEPLFDVKNFEKADLSKEIEKFGYDFKNFMEKIKETGEN